MVAPLALCQFVASYAGTNMNVAISSIAKDLNTNVTGVQVAITMFMLTMSALMIPGSKLSDSWGRKRCFQLGLVIYGAGGLVAAAAPSLPVLIGGYSGLEGIGSALMIPPVYILITVLFTDLPTRAKYFGVVSGAAGLGAAAGPLVGGLITTTTSWRVSFLAQVALVVLSLWLARRLVEPPATLVSIRKFDLVGALESAIGLFLVVFGVLLSSTYGFFASREAFKVGGTVVIPKGGISPVWLFVAAGAIVLVAFMFHLKHRAQAGREPLVAPRVMKNRVANLGLITQNIQWLVLQGTFFVVSVFLQTVRHYSAIKTGLVLTPATIGILLSSAVSSRMARRRSQKSIIIGGFVATLAGMLLLMTLGRAHSSIWTFAPGLLMMGLGVGAMLTSSVNVVQSAFSDADQGAISGVSRSVSNLGSALGTAIAGSVLVSTVVEGNAQYIAAMIVLAVAAAIGLLASVFIPRHLPRPDEKPSAAPSTEPSPTAPAA